MYGTQTMTAAKYADNAFENDVKMYGTQTSVSHLATLSMFENDVKMYGTQTLAGVSKPTSCLRMM